MLAELRGRDRWLLVFDNAENPEDLAGWLPGGSGHVLITSRAPGWAEVAVPVEIDVLARAESVTILQKRVPALSAAEAGAVAEALGDLPLAVVQAASFMADTGMPAGGVHRLPVRSGRGDPRSGAAVLVSGVAGGSHSARLRRPARRRPGCSPS